jgi:multiple sugar transport system permease protein
MVRKKSPWKVVAFYVLVGLLVAFVFYPFAWMLTISFRYNVDALKPGFFQKFTLTQYEELFGLKKSIRQQLSGEQKELYELAQSLPKDQREAVLKKIYAKQKKSQFPFLKYFKNSLFLAGIAALLSLIVSIFGAYSFSRLKYPGRGTIQRGVLLVYLFGGTILMVPLYQIFSKIGMTSNPTLAMISLLIIYMLQTLPVSLYMLGNYFRTIPYSIEEAAIIDGCTRIEAIWRIVVPLSLPAIVTVYIYSFMIGWNEYLFASIFIRPFPSYYTLPVGLSELFNSQHAIWAKMMAASVITAIPVVALFMAMEKYLTAGFTAGGVKE